MGGRARCLAVAAGLALAGCDREASPPPDARDRAARQPRPPDSLAFTCLGNEPGWMLSIDRDSLRFAGDYGEIVASYPGVRPRRDGDTLVFESEGGSSSRPAPRLRTFLVRDSCSDGMSDRVYEYRARVLYGQKGYFGCARRR